MTATKAMTQGEKRRRKAARAPETAQDGRCAVTGLRIAASKEARQRPSQSDTEACRKSALRWCAVMGWPTYLGEIADLERGINAINEHNASHGLQTGVAELQLLRKQLSELQAGQKEQIERTRDQRIATLYGRLAILERISEDAYLAMREYEAVDLRYRREVLGTAHHVEYYASRTVMDAEELRDHIRQITDHWMDAQAVINSWSGPIREQFHRALATDDTPPAYVSDTEAKCVEVVAHALARHFKKRS